MRCSVDGMMQNSEQAHAETVTKDTGAPDPCPLMSKMATV